MSRFVGIDLGIRTKHQAAVFDGSKRRGKSFKVEVSRKGFDELLSLATKDADGPVSFVFEPTGLAWLVVAAYVISAGHRVYVAKTQKASDLRKFYRKHTKTNAVDADVLAQLPQIDPKGVHELELPRAEQTTLRRLVKRHERLKREAGKQKQRIHAIMEMANPPVMDAQGEDKFTKGAVSFYRKYADPEKVVKLGRKRFIRFWSHHSKGKGNLEVAGRVFEACCITAELYRDLRQAAKLPFDYVEVQEEINRELELLEVLEKQIKQQEKRISELYMDLDPERTLEQLRGIGPTIAPAIEALVGNVKRFPTGSQFASYCGLCPRKNKTGNSDKRMPITKTGHRLLKKYLYIAADIARHWDPEFAAYYARRYANGQHHDKIIIDLAHKMALRVYVLLKRREEARKATVDEMMVKPPVRYVLRTPEGREVSKKEARDIILEKYALDVVAPNRKAKKRKTGTAANGNGWPPKDATNAKSASPSEEKVSYVLDSDKPTEQTRSEPIQVREVLEHLLHSVLQSGGKLAPSLVENLLIKEEKSS